MGLGGAVFSALALAGLTALLQQAEWLSWILKLAGGGYLLYLAMMLWRDASELPGRPGKIELPTRKSLVRSFSTALLTQLSNPKTAVV
ncbi:MAG TPA: LysE family transporter, partial [Steroidobacteraceae bacterium]|nr:LysE family transporter [Steroidobacteraceae bacterium]